METMKLLIAGYGTENEVVNLLRLAVCVGVLTGEEAKVLCCEEGLEDRAWVFK